MELNQTRLIKHLKKQKSNFLPKIKEAGDQAAIQLANRVSYLFPKYTLHDIGHSIRVMEYMADLVGDLSRLTELEISILIMSALLHDIGMAIGEDEIQKITEGKRDTEHLVFSAMVKRYEDDQNHALQEFVRRTHAELSARIALEVYGKFMILADMPGASYAEDVSKVCQSHTGDASFVNTLPENGEKGYFKYNLKFCSHILRIADLLDIDSRRTPLTLYELVRPKEIGDIEWLQHFSVSNADKVKLADETGIKRIEFYGRCKDPKIHRKLYRYFGWINEELQNANKNIAEMPHNYRLNIDDSILVHIEPEGYTFSDFKLTVDFHAITELLMGENIYGEKRLGLRELIQNSIDACKIRQEVEAKSADIGRDAYKPAIRIILDAPKNKAIIRDNGIGMTDEVLKKFFLNIGRSYYVSDEYAFRGLKYRPIGAYGIGFLSCFMLSNSVVVRTKPRNSQYRYDLELEKGDEYICFTQTEDYSQDTVGTDVELDYKQFVTAMDMQEKELENFVKDYFIFDDIRCEIIDAATAQPIAIETGTLASHIKVPNDRTMLCLNKFLNGADAFACIKKHKQFIRSVAGITQRTGSFFLYFDNGKLFDIDEIEVGLKELHQDEKIIYLEIPLLRNVDEDDFDKAVELLEDVDQAIDKIDDQEMLFIFAPGSVQCDLESGDTEKDEDFELISGVTITDALDSIGLKGKRFCPKVYKSEVHAVLSDDGQLLLPYKMSEKKNRFSFFKEKNRATLYVRNVLIKDYIDDEIQLPIASIIDVNHIYANILNPKVAPEVSRNRLAPKITSDVAYALNKAVHLAAYEQLDCPPDERNLLKKFIESHYNKSNFLIKEQ
ncbi:MAG: ATP-binding protein [Deltaproteobacteria bacterium]|nr:ATP-binding protein [Deltaproteobacteria bacterium]